MLSEEEVLRRKAELEERRAWKRKYRRRQIIFYSLFFTIGIIVMVFTARFTYYRYAAVTQADGVEEGRLLVLFLGTDDKSTPVLGRYHHAVVPRHQLWGRWRAVHSQGYQGVVSFASALGAY